MEYQIWHPPAVSVGEGLIKGKMASPSTSVWEKADSPQILSWCWTIQFLPVFLWCLLSCCCGAGAQSKWDWVSLWLGPLRGTAWNSRSLPLPWASVLANFYSPELQQLLFLALEPLDQDRESWCGAGTTHFWDIPPNIFPLHVEYLCYPSLPLLLVSVWLL